MAQKIYPRSLRNPAQCASDFSFYSEHSYASLWKKTMKLSSELLSFCQKNLLYKKKNKGYKKSKNKKYKYKTFYNSRFFVSNVNNGLQISPILFKFYKQSLSNKYNPIKAVYKVRRTVKSTQKSNSKQGFYKRSCF